MGDAGDNYTFYMIPQKLTGSNVEVYVHCTDGTTINVPLKGEWKAGTTRTYKLSQINSTWTYVLTPTDPERAANYDENESQAFGITSYRYSPCSPSQRQAVPWKVVGYDGSVLKPSCKSILLSTQFHKYLLPLHHEESPIITLHLSRCTCRLL